MNRSAVYSMTGFGKAGTTDKKRTVGVEIQSVNGKYASVKVSLPRYLSSLEHKVKDLINKEGVRGSIHVGINWENHDLAGAFDDGRLEAHYRFLVRLKKKFRLAGDITLDQLLRVAAGDLAKNTINAGTAWKTVRKTVLAAIADWQTSREREGRALARFLAKECAALDKNVRSIRRHDPARIRKKKLALKKKIRTATGATPAEAEMAAELQKVDITEETDRLTSHLEHFRSVLTGGGSIGRQLNFIVQEMHREANTMSVKAGDLKFIRWGMEAKECIERLKEQVQNVA